MTCTSLHTLTDRQRTLAPARAWRASLRRMILAWLLAPTAVLADPALSWFDGARPNQQALSAVTLLQSAAHWGLEPDDYDARRLARTVQQALQLPVDLQPQRRQIDTALTQAVHRYLSDLANGRIAPTRIGANFAPTRRATGDIRAQLQSALTDGSGIEALADRLARQAPMAVPLQQVLQRYRALQQHPAWNTALPTPSGGKLTAGQSYAGLATLAQRLVALGDLAPDLPLPAVLDPHLVAAVERFQLRHGLVVDGVIGRNTLAQLAVTPAQRVRQIALTMERMRWTPVLQAPRMIVVNVPEFMLRAYEVDQGRVNVRLEMNIIVGKALDTRTPLFDEDMRFIEFSPNWNVPYSIASKELVPRLRKDPDHFTQQGFEFVSRSGAVLGTLSDEHLDAVLAGTLRIRQRPGPKNALGDIKFIFPNDASIFLHHTSTPRLFARPRRDFSHGCIRVEAPVALARFVLQDDPRWSEERIREAMALGKSRTIRLQQPVPVLIAYSTVVVKQDMVFFLADLYHHDARLDQALRARSSALHHAELPDPNPR